MIHFSKKNFVLLLLVSTILMMGYTYFSVIKEPPILSSPTNEGGLPAFYTIQGGNGIPEILGVIFVFTSMLILPFIYSYQPINARINQFDFMVTTRISKSKIPLTNSYLNRLIVTNFVYTFIFFLTLILVQAITINIFYQPFIFQKTSFFLTQGYLYYLSPNGLTNFLLYLMLAPLGTALFSTFVIVVGLYLKNFFVYLASGLVLSLVMIVGPALMRLLIGSSNFDVLFYGLEAESLLRPGLTTFGGTVPTFSALVAYILSFCFYSIIIVCLYLLRVRLDKKAR